MTVELIYKCDDQQEYTDLLNRLGGVTPVGYIREDDGVNLCVKLTRTDPVDVNG